MCKLKKYHKTSNTQIDKCMRKLIDFIDDHSNMIEVIACCCGHYKYPMTIIVEHNNGIIYDLMSDIEIPRKRRFYKRDKQGYYYIPEIVKRK